MYLPPMTDGKPQLTVLLAAPRGFCAGVVRAIRIVEEALKKYGPPVYVRQYLREEDGTRLVLTSRELSKATANAPASYGVVDSLVVKPQKDAEFSIACVQGEDPTLNFIGEAKGKEDKEWWTDVRRAWEISLESGQISSIKAKGVRCTNPGW